MAFTQEELEAMRQADAEIEADFVLTDAEREEGRLRDRASTEHLRTPQELKRLQYHRDYYQRNRERIRERQKAYNLEHKEEIQQQKARYYAEHKEAIRAEIRDRHRANPEKRRARDRAYYQANREAVLAKNRESYYRVRARKKEGNEDG